MRLTTRQQFPRDTLTRRSHTWLAALLLGLGVSATDARDPDEGYVHWAYSAYFGTGWYRIGDRQDVFVLRTAPRWNLDGLLGWQPAGEVRLEFRLPVALGLHRIDFDLPEIIDPDNFGTLTVAPGVEAEVSVTPRWTLRPHAYLGAGTELNGPQTAWSYWAGIKSRYQIGDGAARWALLNSIGYIGYTPNEGASSDAVPVMAGLETGWTLDSPGDGAAPYRLDGHLIYTSYLDDLEFIFGSGRATEVGEEWELGLALHRGTMPLKLWHFEFDQVGLAYRANGGGEFRGVSLQFRSVFER